MQNQRRLHRDIHLVTTELAQALLVDTSMIADNGILSVGYVNTHLLAIGIEDDDDVTPVVAAGIVLQSEGHHILRSIEKLEMLPHQVGRT